MYVTRPLSTYLREPEALSLPPPDGPNSGVLVIQDEAAQPTCCFGLLKSDEARLLFPQNKNLKVQYAVSTGTSSYVEINRVHFIPVLNKPLSSNQYYVIGRGNKHTGEAHISSTEAEDMKTCCFCSYVSTRKPQPLNPNSMYQQFEIHRQRWGGFVAKSVAPDGIPPDFLRTKGWGVYTSTPSEFQLTEASGLNRKLRACLPEFNFKLSEQSSSPTIVVGKWYCPFMFIKEGQLLKDQMKRSTYYEMTLEQQWVQIYYRENNHNEGNVVNVDVVVEGQVVTVDGRRVNQKQVVDGVMWFRSGNDVGLNLAIIERIKLEEENFGWVAAGGTDKEELRVKRVEEFGGIGGWRKFGCYVLVERRVTHKDVVDGVMWFRRGNDVGLSLAIIERMKLEEENFGWAAGGTDKEKLRVKRMEEFGGIGGWKKFGCYVLVERFVLKRMGGSLVLTHEFRHTNQTRSKWE
ncbi:hypothetical protein Tsubulata_033472 [Turnera subulata]|uniref:Uncharacterized protein n=1 Tax=Turnera subulata TaxID=218843 RepID=A0A9Q0G7D8_9ROSI|nr:hypothetical protein Tsubulata_033472 [Turnera subulata]